MLDKTLKAALPITIIITIVQTVMPTGFFSFLNSFSMIITSILVYSIGWVVTSFVYSARQENYSVARHIALASIVSIPLVAIIFVPSFLYPYIVGKAFTFRFLAIIAFFSYLYLVFTDDKYKPNITTFTAGFTIFAVVMAIATMFSMDSARSFWSNYERMEGYINLLSLFVLAITASSLKISEIEWKRLFSVHLWISTIVSSVGVMQYIIGILKMTALGSLPVLSLCLTQGSVCRVDSTLGNSIYLGIYAALTFWLIIFAIFGKKVRGNLFPVLAGINLLAVLFSGTRGVWVGMAAGLAVLLISKYWFDGNKKAVAVTIISGAAFIIIFGGTMLYARQNNLWQDNPVVVRFSSVNTLFARWNIWKTAIISWEQKPVFGWGQENFIHAFNLNYNPAMYGQETYFDHPHNTYLGWLVFGGILGFLAFLIMLGSSMYGIIRSNLQQEKENDLIIPILLALITTYCVHIFFVFDNLTSSLLIVMSSVYFGSYSYGIIKLPTFKDGAKTAVGIATTVLAVYCVYVAIYKPSYANLTTIEAMTYQQRAQTTNPIEVLNGTKALYEKALAMNTFGNYEIREFYLQKSLEYLNLIPQVTDESVKNAIVGVAQSALNQFEIQIKNNSFDHRAKFMFGLYYLNIRQYDKAVEVLSEAVTLAPNKQIALVYLAKAYILKGDIANAMTYYERAINVTPRNIAGFNTLRQEYIQVLIIAGQEERAALVISQLLPPGNRDEFMANLSQIKADYNNEKDFPKLIKALNDASNANPTNQNLVVWLAQAYAASGDANNAMIAINRGPVPADYVQAYITDLQNYMAEQKAKLEAQKAAK